MSDQTIRLLTRADDEALQTCLDSAFGWGVLTPEELDLWQAQFELDRSISTWDGPQLVGTAGAYSLQLGVPGGVVPLVGVTLVSVSPTHRRTGVLTRMMHRQLHELAAAGVESMAGLWASEAPIYQRFGYGAASWRGAGAVRSGPFSATGEALRARHSAPIRLVDRDEGVAHASGILDTVVEGTPGMLRRSPATWAQIASDLPRHRGTASRQWWAVTEGGFARYRLQPGGPGEEGTVVLGELQATTPEAHAVLWRWLLDLDLTDRVTSRLFPAHPAVTHLLLDPRLVEIRVEDALWLRIISLPRALAERTYSAPLDLTLRVHDDLLSANDGTWRVQVDELGAATVTATASAPDLELSIRELGAAHLGATGLTALAAAGRVVEHTPGALRSAARAWAWDIPAVTSEIF